MTGFSCVLHKRICDNSFVQNNYLRSLGSELGSSRENWSRVGAISYKLAGVDMGTPATIARADTWFAIGHARLDNRAELCSRVQCPPTRTDLYIILAIVRAAGIGAVSTVCGDFAVVFWDEASRRLYAARDAFGVAPLHFRETCDSIMFASSARSLRTSDAYDPLFLVDYLLEGYSREERSVFPGVRSLSAGHTLNHYNGNTTLSRYWDAMAITDIATVDSHGAIEQFRELLEQSVICRVGNASAAWAQLSGGVDSSSVVCLATRLVKTQRIARGLQGAISFVDDLGDGDEKQYLDMVSRQLSIPTERISNYWFWQDDGESPPLSDVPSPTYPLWARDRQMAATATHFGGRALLSGWGADHYLTGTLYFTADFLASLRLSEAAKTLASWAVAGQRSFWRLGFENALVPAARGLMRGSYEPACAPAPWVSSPRSSRAYLRERCARTSLRIMQRRRLARLDTAKRMSCIAGTLERGVLSEVLEMRYPFLHRPLVEFALRLSPTLLARPLTTKWILRQAMKDVLPEDVRIRSTKAALYARGVWSLKKESSLISSMIHSPILSELGFVDRDRLKDAVNRIDCLPFGLAGALLTTLALETWLRVTSGRWRHIAHP